MAMFFPNAADFTAWDIAGMVLDVEKQSLGCGCSNITWGFGGFSSWALGGSPDSAMGFYKDWPDILFLVASVEEATVE
jgi:hypothetical protein